jgi:hypothetical protein
MQGSRPHVRGCWGIHCSAASSPPGHARTYVGVGASPEGVTLSRTWVLGRQCVPRVGRERHARTYVGVGPGDATATRLLASRPHVCGCWEEVTPARTWVLDRTCAASVTTVRTWVLGTNRTRTNGEHAHPSSYTSYSRVRGCWEGPARAGTRRTAMPVRTWVLGSTAGCISSVALARTWVLGEWFDVAEASYPRVRGCWVGKSLDERSVAVTPVRTWVLG